jgi:hypothetical protein
MGTQGKAFPPDRQLSRTAPRQRDPVRAVADSLYQALDRQWETHCVVVGQVVVAALARLGVAAELVPCQLVYMGAGHTRLIGFTGGDQPGRWGGHAAVRVGQHLIDGTVANLRHRFGLDVPAVVVPVRMPVASSILARHRLDGDDRLLWLAPPATVDPTPPHQPEALVNALADRLAARVRS